MCTIVRLLLVAGLALAAGATGVQAVQPAGQVQISGKEYVRLADWARANGFETGWLKHDETLQLRNPNSKIIVTVDSREVDINGVQVLLCFPIAIHNGAACIAELDLQNTLQPLITPSKNQPRASLKTICLDPGHGGRDPGFETGSHQEKKYTLLLAQEVRDQLSRAGIKASLTRTTDQYIELPTRPELAKRRHADLFVSLHFNSIGSSAGSVHGAETYCLTPPGAASTNARGEGGGAGAYTGNRNNPKNMLLAYEMQKSLVKELGAEDRGVRRARYWVLRDAAMPAVLIEGGYMSHPAEGPRIFDAGYRRRMARAIVDGLLAYKRLVEQAG
jgi:N-acetylmuramoyl-L-alanine amidase